MLPNQTRMYPVRMPSIADLPHTPKKKKSLLCLFDQHGEKKELQYNIVYRGPYFLKDNIPAHQIGVNTGAEVSWKPSLSALSVGCVALAL